MLSPKNLEILESIRNVNYIFVDSLKNCGSQETRWEVSKRFPFWGGVGVLNQGVHARTILQTCGMSHAKWALRCLKNHEIRSTVLGIIDSYYRAGYCYNEDRRIIVRRKLIRKLEGLLGKPSEGQEMCVFHMHHSWWPERDWGWFLYSKNDINKMHKIEEPF